MDPWTWVQIALLVVSLGASIALRQKVIQPKPAAFEDIQFPQFEEGTPQCVVFGDCWTSDWMVLTVGNYRTEEIKVKGGKK